MSVDLPLVSRIVRVSPEQPFLAVGFALDPVTVTELLSVRRTHPADGLPSHPRSR